MCGRDVRNGLVRALAMTDPFGGMALIIMTIAGKSIAVRTERHAVLIIAALEAGERQVICLCMPYPNGAQGVEILIYVLKDFIKPLTGVTEEFTDLEAGEAFAQILQAWDGEQMVVAVGRGAGTCQRPDQKEPIVDNVEGFGFVSEVMFAVRGSRAFVFFGSIRIGSARLVGTGVIHIGRERIAPGSETTMIQTVRCITRTAFLASQTRRTGTPDCGL